MKRLGYFPALDGIRALAVGAVIAVHSGFPYALGGQNGVTLFFMLSGFLITKLILEEHDRFGRLDVPRFIARRFVRLSPPLLAMVASRLPSAWSRAETSPSWHGPKHFTLRRTRPIYVRCSAVNTPNKAPVPCLDTLGRLRSKSSLPGPVPGHISDPARRDGTGAHGARLACELLPAGTPTRGRPSSPETRSACACAGGGLGISR